ncbi:hypothetical protein Ancab_011471 [Ancistrocladus abbreviatus]
MTVATTNSSSGDWCTAFAIRVSMFCYEVASVGNSVAQIRVVGLGANLAHFRRKDRENYKRQALHNNDTNSGISKRGAITVTRNARLKSYADVVRHNEDGPPQKKITKQQTYNQYGQHQFDLEASLCEADLSWLQDCYMGEIKLVELLEGL